MTADAPSMERRIADYLAHRMPGAGAIVVDELSRIPGGTSQETFRLRACWIDEAGAAVERKLICRREPAAGLVEAERDLEFNVYRALAGKGIPVPEALFLELDGHWLDRPFFIMEMCDGKPGQFYMPGDPYDGQEAEIGRQFWHILGTLAAVDHHAVGLNALRGGTSAAGFWRTELDHWQALLDMSEPGADPVVSGAIRWLRRNPPAEPATPALVHGDYRSGNFLFTPDGQISGILDWEMSHIGDPVEDIAFAIDPMWTMTRHLPLEEGLAIWEHASGRVVDRAVLDWWRLFAAVKCCAIWATAANSFACGKGRAIGLAMSGFNGGHVHHKLILEMMRARGAMS